MRVLLVAPDRTVKGGITTVIEGILASKLAEMHQFEHLSTHRDDVSKIGKFVHGIKAYFRFVRLALSFKPQVVHVHSSFGASFFRKAVIIMLGRMLGQRQINHIHGADFDSFYNDAGAMKKRLARYVYDLAASTVVLSKEWEDRIKGICRRSRVYCLNNFAVLPTAEEAAEIERYSERGNIVLFLGEVGKRKGAFDLPAIIQNVAAHVPDVVFVIAGNGEIEAVQEMVNRVGCANNAQFTGWIGPDQKRDLLLDSRVFLLPSYNEGLPMSILEAMSYGLPVVSTTVGGIPEVVKEDVNGYLFQPGDVEGTAHAIVRLLQNDGRAIKIGAANRELIRSTYSLDAYAEKLDAIYKETANV
jgi:glycosyltransferase involved in cell wall biosynthesis